MNYGPSRKGVRVMAYEVAVKNANLISILVSLMKTSCVSVCPMFCPTVLPPHWGSTVGQNIFLDFLDDIGFSYRLLISFAFGYSCQIVIFSAQ